jgi:flavin-binding protein dodecin
MGCRAAFCANDRTLRRRAFVIIGACDPRGTRRLPRNHQPEEIMPDKKTVSKVVKVIEVLAESDKTWEDAAQNALEAAGKTLRNIRSIYIQDFEAKVENGRITRYRVNAKISFQLEPGRPE